MGLTNNEGMLLFYLKHVKLKTHNCFLLVAGSMQTNTREKATSAICRNSRQEYLGRNYKTV